MIINIRGTNGSGKTTIIRKIFAMAEGRPRQINGVLGTKKAEANELKLPGIKKPLYILGPYLAGNKFDRGTGGCDQIQPYDLVLELLDKYSVLGHVLFEGVLISSSYGRVGRYMETKGKKNAVMVFLTTPLDVCIKHVKNRRKSRKDDRPFDPHNLTQKYNQIEKSKKGIRSAGKVGMLELDPSDADAAAKTLVGMLK
jgi:hypothetical protein